jgi:NitT/TauT family transport system ATP-binding protein
VDAPESPVRVEGLCITRGGHQLYRSFSVAFAAGTVTAIIAASGRGKTTLLDCIARLLTPDAGRVTAPFRVAYLFQEPLLLPWRTVRENVLLVSDGPEAARCLALSGLTDKSARYPAELSGGEQQRAAFARALACRAPVMLLDEAFQSLDVPVKLAMMEQTRIHIAARARTAILVTHDIREALCLAARILVLTGEPVTIARDLAIPVIPVGEPLAERYIRPPPEIAEIEADILGVLKTH